MITPFKRFLGVSALIFIVLAVLLAGTFIGAIWIGFDNEILGKTLATEGVLLVLSALLYTVAKGMCDKPKDSL